MSIRRGYWSVAGEAFEGPFKTIKEAKEASASIPNTTEVSIRSLIAIERRDETGKWVTLH